MKLFKKAKKGFTLVELVVVIAVIAILAGVSVGAYFGITDSANKSKLEQEAKTAWTTVRLASLAGESHSTLDSSGLTINSESGFKNKVNFISGTNYYIDTSLPETLTGKALIFDTTSVSGSFDTSTTYKSFTYYDSTVTNKTGCKVDILSGKSSFVGGDFNVGGEDEKAPLAVSVSATDLSINEGSGDRITATITGGEGSKTATWTSSDRSEQYISIVQEGYSVKISAKTPTIEPIILILTVSEPGFVTQTVNCKITVLDVSIPVTSISLDKTAIEFTEAQIGTDAIETLTYTVYPSNCDAYAVTWESSNTSVAQVSNGIVSPTGVGSATIKAKINDSIYALCNVIVTQTIFEPTKISLSPSYITADEETSNIQTILVSYEPTGVELKNTNITWSSSNTSIATVENGVISTVSPGTAVITATTENGVSATCTVVSIKTKADVTGVTLNKTHIELDAVPQSEQLIATCYPQGYTLNQTVTWSSTDEEVATVDQTGFVTSVNPGLTTIKALVNGHEATCTVRVHKVVTGLKLSQTTLIVKASGEGGKQLTVTQFPQDATNKEPIKWEVIEGQDYIEVDQDGRVKGKFAYDTITNGRVRASANGYTAECIVKTELPALENLIINEDTDAGITVQAGEYLDVTYSTNPLNADMSGKTVTWSSSNTNIAKVEKTASGARITGIFEGNAKLTVTCGDDNKDDNADIKVTSREIKDDYSVEEFLRHDSSILDFNEIYTLTGYIAKWDTSRSTEYQSKGCFWLVDELDDDYATEGIYVDGATIFDELNSSGIHPISIKSNQYFFTNPKNSSVYNTYDIGSKIDMKVLYNVDSTYGKRIRGIVYPNSYENNGLVVNGYFNGSDTATPFNRDSNNKHLFTIETTVNTGDPLSLDVSYYNATESTIINSVDVGAIKNVEDGKATKKGTYTFTFNFLTKAVTCSFKVDGDYYLVKDVNQISDGDNIVITAFSHTCALGTTQKDNNRNAVAITKGDETISLNDEVQIITAEISAGKIALKTDTGYLYAASSSSNYLRTQTTNNANGVWNLTIKSTGEATLIATGTNTHNSLRYNSGSDLFSCYDSGQSSIAIYKLNDSKFETPTPKLKSFAINPSSTINLTVNQEEQLSVKDGLDTEDNPYSLTNVVVTWTSSDSKKVEVTSAGKIIAKSECSNVIITASIQGVTATVSVNVKQQTANTYNYTFTSTQFSANGTKTLNGIKWTLAGGGGYWGYDGTKGQQFGSGNKPYKNMTFTSESISNISKITIITSGASSIDGSITIKVGGNSLKTFELKSSDTTCSVDVSNLSGAVCFDYTQKSSKAIYIKSISIEYVG